LKPPVDGALEDGALEDGALEDELVEVEEGPKEKPEVTGALVDGAVVEVEDEPKEKPEDDEAPNEIPNLLAPKVGLDSSFFLEPGFSVSHAIH